MERSSGCKLFSYGAALILRQIACLRPRDYIAQVSRHTQKYDARGNHPSKLLTGGLNVKLRVRLGQQAQP